LTLDLDRLNALDRASFTERVGGVFERSPWVADSAWERRPFLCADELHAAMSAVVRAAPSSRQVALIAAHPELADPAVPASHLSASSAAEQHGAGLDQLRAAQASALDELNRAYRERFQFPLVVCVREHTVESIIAWGSARLGRERSDEIETALSEIEKIARARLEAL
jgi:OHCU decarboxylase